MITEAHALLMSARGKILRIGIDEYHFNRALSSGSYKTFAMVDKPNWLESSTRGIAALAWDCLFKQSGLRTFLDQEARHEWACQVSRAETPPITMEHVHDTFKTLYEKRDSMFRRGLRNIFERLNPRYKSNSVWCFNKKIILSSVFNRPPFNSIDRNAFDALDDLVRVFCILAGEPEPDHRNGIFTQATEALSLGESIICTPYAEIRLFKTARTAHVIFTDMQMLDKVNQLLAEEYNRALPEDGRAVKRGCRKRAGAVEWGDNASEMG